MIRGIFSWEPEFRRLCFAQCIAKKQVHRGRHFAMHCAITASPRLIRTLTARPLHCNARSQNRCSGCDKRRRHTLTQDSRPPCLLGFTESSEIRDRFRRCTKSESSTVYRVTAGTTPHVLDGAPMCGFLRGIDNHDQQQMWRGPWMLFYVRYLYYSHYHQGPAWTAN